MSEDKMFIGDLGQKTGVPVKTIRYYEDLGLLDKPRRSFSKYRMYSPADVEKLLFIRKAKDLGLTLAEIKRVLSKSRQGLQPTCCAVREVFNAKIKEYESKIAELSDIKKKLEHKLKNWVEPHEARTMKFTVCPQIEVEKKGQKK